MNTLPFTAWLSSRVKLVAAVVVLSCAVAVAAGYSTANYVSSERPFTPHAESILDSDERVKADAFDAACVRSLEATFPQHAGRISFIFNPKSRIVRFDIEGIGDSHSWLVAIRDEEQREDGLRPRFHTWKSVARWPNTERVFEMKLNRRGTSVLETKSTPGSPPEWERDMQKLALEVIAAVKKFGID